MGLCVGLKMNRTEMLVALEEGCKVTHCSFTEEEWMMSDGGRGLVFEDGVRCSLNEFWMYRQNERFNDGWSIFEQEDQDNTWNPFLERMVANTPIPSKLSNNNYITKPSYVGTHEPYVRERKRIGRNEPCPCRSGKKYKKCHLGED